MSPAPFLVTLLDRVKAIVRRVMRPAAACVKAFDTDTSARAAADGPASLRHRAQGWLSARLDALSALMRHIEMGEAVTPPVRAARAAVDATPRVARRPVAPRQRLPRGFGWMCALGPKVQQDGQTFAAWLNEPATQAMVLAAPQRMAGLIGPILTATGQRRPAWFPSVPQRSQASRRPIIEPAPLPRPAPPCGPCPRVAQRGAAPVRWARRSSPHDADAHRTTKIVISAFCFQNGDIGLRIGMTILLRYRNVTRLGNGSHAADSAYPAAIFTRRSA